MQIEGRQRLPLFDHMGDALEIFQKSRQFHGHFEYHRRAELCGLPRVPAELERIAKALLGVQQEGLAGEGCVSEPQRLAEYAMACLDAAALPAPFVFVESFDEPPYAQQA